MANVKDISRSLYVMQNYDTIDVLKKRMPFKMTIERDSDDKENLSISAISDKEGNDVMDGNLEIHIQSLGVDDQYWLDSGEFDF